MVLITASAMRNTSRSTVVVAPPSLSPAPSPVPRCPYPHHPAARKQRRSPPGFLRPLFSRRYITSVAASGGSADAPGDSDDATNRPSTGAGDSDPVLSSSGSDTGSDTGPPLTLGSAVLERMAKLRALDEYRELMAEEDSRAAAAAAATTAAAKAGVSARQGRRAGGAAAAAGAAATAAGDDSALLLRCALLIARHRYPSLDEGGVYDMLDGMARRVSALLPVDPGERYPMRVVAAINRVMYHDFGFKGNEEDYYNADNSCINRVMERRVGIPITLSLVYSEVARRVGLPMRGVNLPGHFMLQPVRPPAPRGKDTATSSGTTTTTTAAVTAVTTSGVSAQQQQEQEQRAAASQPQEEEEEEREAEAGEGTAPAQAGTPDTVPDRVPVRGQGAAGPQAGSGGQRGGVEAAGRSVDGAGAVAAAAAAEAEEEDAEAGPLEVLVDAFRSGEVCYPAEAAERISQLMGTPVRIDPHALQDSRPLPPRMFLMRMLGNLRSIYLTTQQVDSLLMVLKLMRATLGEPSTSSGSSGAGPGSGAGGAGPWSDPVAFASAAASLARDEGLCYFALQRYPECLDALKEYMHIVQSGVLPLPAEEAQTVSALIVEARKRMTQQAQQ